jgi:hypothetical protein
MTDAEVRAILNDPFAKLVLRRGIFPKNLGEILAAFDAHNGKPKGLPETTSFVIAEGGQIPFKPGIAKGSTRLITVRGSANGSPEVMISTLLSAGVDPRSNEVLHEVQGWDPVNRTMHFYQRQAGAWFWCGQSDMALVPPTRGAGPFDSHINGYPVMKELQSPWVHWRGPDLAISETAYAPDDPRQRSIVRQQGPRPESRDSCGASADGAVEHSAFREARGQQGLTDVKGFARQLLDSTSANLVSTRTKWSAVLADRTSLDDLPPSFFFDINGMVTTAGLKVTVPPLQMSGNRYAALVHKYDMRLRNGPLDLAGDVPFAFTVPERAEEDSSPPGYSSIAV